MFQNIFSTFLVVSVTQQVAAVELYDGVIAEKNFGPSTWPQKKPQISQKSLQNYDSKSDYWSLCGLRNFD